MDVLTRCLTSTAPFAVALFVMAAPAVAQSPFSSMGGTWSGPGSIQLADGKQERVRCRAYYTPKDGGTQLGLAIRCAAPDYKIELRSQLNFSNGLVSGSWEERTYNATGSVTGRATASRINLSIRGGVEGAMTVTFGGSSQIVSIQTSTNVLRGVSISLSRS